MAKDKKEVGSRHLGLRFVLIASLVLLLLATATEYYRSPGPQNLVPTPTEKSADDLLIVPGTRIGPITLGLSVKKAQEILGNGKLRPHENGLVHLYERLGLALYSEDGVVVSVTARSPVFRTKSGVGVGQDVDLVLKSLGKQYEFQGEANSYALHNWEQGWHVGVKDDRVEYFQISLPVLGEIKTDKP